MALAKALCILFDVKADIKTIQGKRVVDYWLPAQQNVITPDLIKKIKNYAPPHDFELQRVKKAIPVVLSDNFSDEVMR